MSDRRSGAFDAEVGKRVRLRREQLGISQSSLGTQLGITFQQIQKYERGTNRIGAGRLQAIAIILQVPVSFFFGETSPPLPDENVLNFVQSARALRLVQAFSAIDDASLQDAVVCLMERIAAAQRKQAREAN